MATTAHRAPGTSSPVRLAAAPPLWRREPYRVLFVEAIVLAWAGVLIWLLYGLGIVTRYASQYHAVTQVEGFLACIATGFLFTFIPRRTGTMTASTLEIAVAAITPVLVVIAAWFRLTVLSQAAWLVLTIVVFAFALRRLASRGAMLKLPNAIVWVPTGLLFGLGGAALLIWGESDDATLVRVAGSGFLFQGMLTAFIAGIGATLIPVLTRGEAHAETKGTGRDTAAKLLHAAGAALFAASFLVEVMWSARIGYIVRAAVVLTVLMASARIDRPPIIPGLHRWLVWLSAWMVPAGFAVAAAFPAYDQAGLHVVFIGGFALMALSVGYHVATAHGGGSEVLSRSPGLLTTTGALLGCALLVRALAELDRSDVKAWFGTAAAIFLVATVCWAALVFPRLRAS